eukprot:CAMPEP_0196802042 /NCGR_PEP_ID=MMETSP1362-20130617/1766_1 /TAXON_ID=163516 /ORGANISM="Leptocylindrus danicus, Strain CCMP1856" /LENGTH=336 /DNA_ID=CAMNT_0042173249 /DNA_START=76 /DNA_END=1086 /DNA_ORIENTATION=-
MAALTRPTEATYAIHENVTVDTTDYEDHTFCGVMFPIEAQSILPVDHIVLESVSIRGALGKLTVWVTKPGANISVDPDNWIQVYEAEHDPSWRRFVELKLDSKIKVRPGENRGVYVHSKLQGDEAIVYDNQKADYTHQDNFLTIYPGLAHVCNKPFGRTTMWGYGNAWRERREFVGKLNYGAVYKLWNPENCTAFGDKFQGMTRTLFMCQRRWESPMSRLPDECIFYILNLCRWDWANDEGQFVMSTASNSELHQQETNSDEEEDNDVGDEDSSDNNNAPSFWRHRGHNWARARHYPTRVLYDSRRIAHASVYSHHHHAGVFNGVEDDDDSSYEEA